MKKIVILTMMLTLTVLSINAQVFQLNGYEKGLTSDLSPVAAGYVWGSIEGAVDISNPFAIAYRVIDCRNNNFNKVIIDGNEIYTKDGVQGNENPKDEDGGNPALTLKPAVCGTIIQIDAYKNGWVYIVAKLQTNKQYMVLKDGTPIGYKIAMESTDERVKNGILNLDLKGEGQNNYLPEERQIQWIIREYLGDLEAATAGNGLGVFYFPVNKGCTYLAYSTGSKISWSGIYFNETEAKTISVDGDGISKTIVDNPNPSPAPAGGYDLWSLAGDSELFGSDWDITDKKNKLTTSDGVNYTRSFIGVNLEKGEYEYKVAKDFSWDVAYPADKAKLIIDEKATYTITFTFNAETHELSATAKRTDGIFYNFITKGKVAEVIQKPNGKYTGNIIIPETVMHEGEEYTVTKIADNAFFNCTGLTSITIPNSVTSIGNYAFSDCRGLTSVSIPNSVTSLGNNAFSQCSGLTSVSISNRVTSIDDYAFHNCSGLTSVLIPNSVTSIKDDAFSYCSGMTSITIPNSVNSIGRNAFTYCTGLTSITIPNSVTSIDYAAFSYCTSLTTIAIPNSLTSIPMSAFTNCNCLTTITIGNSVTNIESRAFNKCSKLTTITIPNSVTSIGSYAFADCSALTTVTIGEKVSSIQSSAFANCQQLTDVFCSAEKVPNTSTDVFNGSYIEYAKLHVPAALLNDYNNNDPWKNFKEIVALEGGDIPEMQKCATPTIAFENGKITFSCETEGAEFISTITPAEINKMYDSEIVISNTYKVTVYATKVGFIDSDKATIEIQASSSILGDVDGNGVVNVADHVKLSDIIMNQEK